MWVALGVVLAVAVVSVLFAAWHARTFAYRCRNCSNEFTLPPLLDFISPHGFDSEGRWRLVRCPRCGHWTRARTIRRSDMSGDGGPPLP